MNINPSSPQGSRQPADPAALDTARAAEAQQQAQARTAKSGAEARPERADTVDVSSEAKALAEQSEARGAESTLPKDRLKEIGERLASGFYDQPEVIDQVARRVAKDPDFLGRSDG